MAARLGLTIAEWEAVESKEWNILWAWRIAEQLGIEVRVKLSKVGESPEDEDDQVREAEGP